MEQTRGRNKAKRNIVLFVIGAFLTALATILPTIGGLVPGASWLTYFVFADIVGAILEIIAIVKLRNVNKHYANALWALILFLLINVAVIVLTIIANVQGANPTLVEVMSWISLAGNLAEALIVVNFVFGTNQLADENGRGMPILTKLIAWGYLGIFLISFVFNMLLYIPAIASNTTAVYVFMIVVLALYVVREVAFLLFLIKSLWRVQE